MTSTIDIIFYNYTQALPENFIPAFLGFLFVVGLFFIIIRRFL